MIKPIVMLEPTEQTVVDPEGNERRSKLAKAVLAHGDQLLKQHPEMRLMLLNLWTPRDATDVMPVHAHVHTAIVSGDNDVSPEQMCAFLDLMIPALIKLRVGIHEDPEQFERQLGRKH